MSDKLEDETKEADKTVVEPPPRLNPNNLPELDGEQRTNLWNAVIKAITHDNGAQYDQSVWSYDGDKSVVFETSCGTAACIAGHTLHEAAALKLIPPCTVQMWPGSGHLDIAAAARILLGLDLDTANYLFSEEFEPKAGRSVPAVLCEIRDLQKDEASHSAIFDKVLAMSASPANEDDIDY